MAKDNEDKLEALRTHILEECKRQGFTVYEFQQLILALDSDLYKRKLKTEAELF